jgi:hypothetical protein
VQSHLPQRRLNRATCRTSGIAAGLLAVSLRSIAPAAGLVVEPPRDDVRRPIYTVLRASQPIAVDGVLDEPIWTRLAPITFVIHDGTGPAPMATKAKLCWDDTYLYVAFSCADRDLTSRITARDDFVWRDDAVEIFLNPECSSVCHQPRRQPAA